jgi:hypothetical protein
MNNVVGIHIALSLKKTLNLYFGVTNLGLSLHHINQVTNFTQYQTFKGTHYEQFKTYFFHT